MNNQAFARWRSNPLVDDALPDWPGTDLGRPLQLDALMLMYVEKDIQCTLKSQEYRFRLLHAACVSE